MLGRSSFLRKKKRNYYSLFILFMHYKKIYFICLSCIYFKPHFLHNFLCYFFIHNTLYQIGLKLLKCVPSNWLLKWRLIKNKENCVCLFLTVLTAIMLMNGQIFIVPSSYLYIICKNHLVTLQEL